MKKSKTQAVIAKQEFSELAECAGHALANLVEHPDCPEYLSARIAELHSGLMSEFNADVVDDIRLRFALGAVKAAEGHRPA